MKRLVAFALVMIGISIPCFAQHGGSHGGFSGHSTSASHGSFHASAPSHFSSAPRSAPGRSFVQPHSFPGAVAVRGAARVPYAGSWRYRRPYVSTRRIGVRYAVGGFVVPGYLGYPFYADDSDDAAAPAQSTAEDAYDGPPPPDLPPYPNQSAPAQAMSGASSPDAPSQDSLTLVFADGRPSVQIHNYMLTRTTLYVLDAHRRDIPLDELDLAATAKVNRDAGIDFRLPEAPVQ
jgi:hypothetical protein